MLKYDCKPLPDLSPKDIGKFLALVYSDGPDSCWLYQGWTSDQGYGMFRACDRNLRAHRLSYFLCTGKDPYPLLLCHTCDIRYPLGDLTYRLCCNPDHMFVGTHADNSRDMAKKGRSTIGDRNPSRLYPERIARGDRHFSRLHPESTCQGERNGNAILTVQDIRDIREICSQGVIPKGVLAEIYGVKTNQITRIVNRTRWACVD